MKKSQSKKSTSENESSPKSVREDFLIAGIGASAGGIQALKEFFENVPADSGVAYVVILHLSPDHDSRLAEILQTTARIPVTQVLERVKVEPNHVYVVPPNQHLGMIDGYITVEPNTSVAERRAPVDIFFGNLAESHTSRAIAVVLSGTGANGSMGIKRIKERGGAAFVQNPREAEFGEMPGNAIATDWIDAVLDVREIPSKIIAYKNNLGSVEIADYPQSRPDDEQAAQSEVELREAHANLARQLRIFDTTLSAITDFTYIFDRDGRFLYSNQALLNFLGISLEEIIGKNFFDLNYPEDLAERLQRQIQEVFSTKKNLTDETPFTSPAGAAGFYEYIFTPVFGADGAVEAVAGSTRDITTRKHSEINLAFLAEVSQDLVRIAEVDEIIRTVGAKIGTFLMLSNCSFMEINEATDEAIATQNWHRADVPSLIGSYRIGEFVTGEFQRAMRAGEIFVVRDTQSDSRTDAAGYAAIKVGAFVSVPLIRDGKWRFLLVAFDSKRRDWQANEIELIGELTTRVWTRLERVRAEKDLRESEERLQALINNLPGGAAFILDRDLRYLLAAGEAIADAEFKPEDFIGKTIYDALAPELVTQHEAMYRKALAGESFTHEHDIRGGTFITRGTPLRAANGDVYAALAVSYDISDRKKAEEMRRESEERLHLLIESASDYAIFTITPDNIIDSWNAGAEKVFGWKEAEIVGKSAEILFTSKDRAAGVPEKEINTAAETGRAEDERWHIRKDGSRFFASGVMQPLMDGKVAGFVKIARDQTEKIKAEKALRDRETLQKLVGAQEDERKRIARDLHDHLGQQLTAVRLKLEAAKEICGEEEICDRIDEIKHLVRSIDSDVGFLAWELRPAALDDFGLIVALDTYTKEWSRHTGIPAEFFNSGLDGTRLAPEIETNLYRISQEALNNVWKHGKAKSANLILEKRGSLINLIVEDDGTGFDVEDQANRSEGLGLIGMRERAALVGGKIQIESTLEKGTTVFVRIPLEI